MSHPNILHGHCMVDKAGMGVWIIYNRPWVSIRGDGNVHHNPGARIHLLQTHSEESPRTLPFNLSTYLSSTHVTKKDNICPRFTR